MQYISDHYHQAKARIRDEILSLDEASLSGTSVDEWVTYFTGKYGLQPIKLLPEPPRIEFRVDRAAKETEFSEVVQWEYESAIIGLPIEQNADMPRVLELQASRGSIPRPKWHRPYGYRDDCIFLMVRNIDEQEVQRQVSLAKDNIAWLNEDIERGNADLVAYVRPEIEARMRTVGARAQRFKSLAEALGAELKLSPETERRLQQVPSVNAEIARLRRPQPRHRTLIRMEPEKFQTILGAIDGQCTAYECTPTTMAKLREEDIRNLILAALNGMFNLDATGETFSKHGKTDIRLKVPEGGIFIAEAKIWGGAQTISEALEQILGYLTWRDAYGVVLLFSRNKEFSRVREAIPATIKAEASLRGEVYQVDHHHWLARHSLPNDGYQTVEIRYLVYDVCADR